MKVFHINASYKPAYIYGGPTMSVSKLCEELTKSGQELEVITTTANGDVELNVKAGLKSEVDGVTVTYFRRITKGNSHFSPALLRFLWKYLRNNRSSNEKVSSTIAPPQLCDIKIVHIHAWWNLVSVGSCLIAVFLSRPVILSPRGTLSNYSFGNRTSILKNIFHQIIGIALLKRCHFHVSSEKEKQDILNIIRPKSITVISNFVNLDLDSDAYEVANTNSYSQAFNSELLNHKTQPFKLLFLSRVEEKKGLDVFFNALHKIELNYHLTIAGTGDPDYILFLKSRASKLGINDKITWIGQQSNVKKFKLLAAHDLMILPSHDESFANVVIESLSVGTPVLISKMVGLADYVLANNFGWVCDHLSNDLAVVLKEASQDEEKMKLIRSEAPNQIALDFNEQHLLTQYLQLYQNISDHV